MWNLEFDVCELQVAQDLGLKAAARRSRRFRCFRTVQRKSLKVDCEVAPENVYDLSIVRALAEGMGNIQVTRMRIFKRACFSTMQNRKEI